MKNKYLNLKKLSDNQLRYIFTIVPALLEDEYVNSYDIYDTHCCLIEMESSYVLASLNYVSFKGLEEVDYFSFDSVFGADPLGVEIDD